MSLDDDNWSLRVAVFGCLVGLTIAVTFLPSCGYWTGEVETFDRISTTASFAFLDDRRVLLLINESYTIPDLVVVDCSENHTSNARTNAEAVLDDLASLILGLPYLSEDAIADSITLECNPIRAKWSKASCSSRTTPRPSYWWHTAALGTTTQSAHSTRSSLPESLHASRTGLLRLAYPCSSRSGVRSVVKLTDRSGGRSFCFPESAARGTSPSTRAIMQTITMELP